MITRSRISSDIASTMPSIAYVMSELKSMKMLMNENAENSAKKEDITELKTIIENQNKIIDKLRGKIETLESEINELKVDLDDKEQYQRRTSLRLFNVPQEDDEDADKCREKS